MPPKTEDLFYQQPSSNDSPMSSSVLDSPVAAMSPTVEATTITTATTNSRNILPPKDSVPFLKRRQVSTASLSGSLSRVLESSDCIIGIILALETLEARVAELLAHVQMEQLQGDGEPVSPLLEACHHSLASRMPHVLRQCKILVDRIDQAGTDHEKAMIATLRSGFALVAAVQFLDTVQEALYCNARSGMDQTLKHILTVAQQHSTKNLNVVPGDATGPAFRVSHWLAPALAFDAVCGPKISTRLEGKLPLNLEVEPVITYMAEDLLTDGKDLAFRRCSLEVLDCRHRPSEFTEGAGGLGVAFVRIQLSPLDDESYPLRIWKENEVEKLIVKEVRAYVLACEVCVGLREPKDALT
jgi:hypothetical protein